jgi:uncharacterized protein DUF5990
MTHELTLRIVLENPPGGVDFGLQKGRGTDYETIQKQRSGAGDLAFAFTLEVKDDRPEGVPALRGPLVQGPAGAKFVYIDIGAYAGQMNTEWSRRLKVPLSGITWAMIDRLSAGSHSVLEARVHGTGKDGGPRCGTVKPFAGWKPARSQRR